MFLLHSKCFHAVDRSHLLPYSWHFPLLTPSPPPWEFGENNLAMLNCLKTFSSFWLKIPLRFDFSMYEQQLIISSSIHIHTYTHTHTFLTKLPSFNLCLINIQIVILLSNALLVICFSTNSLEENRIINRINKKDEISKNKQVKQPRIKLKKNSNIY